MRLFSLSVAKFTNRIMRGSAQMMALPLDFFKKRKGKNYVRTKTVGQRKIPHQQ